MCWAADLWEGGKVLLLVAGSHWSIETAVMAVEAVGSQLSTRSTLLLSNSTASGLRHHQQHRSMTSQPRPGPRCNHVLIKHLLQNQNNVDGIQNMHSL